MERVGVDKYLSKIRLLRLDLEDAKDYDDISARSFYYLDWLEDNLMNVITTWVEDSRIVMT